MSETTIHIATQVTPTLLDGVNRLLPQLSPSLTGISPDELAEIINSPATDLLIAQRDNQMVGMATLVKFRLPDGMRTFVEDVVVDANIRRGQVGTKLTLGCVEAAEAVGADSTALTSGSHRVAANTLYQRLGFEKLDTLFFRWAGGPAPIDVETPPDFTFEEVHTPSDTLVSRVNGLLYELNPSLSPIDFGELQQIIDSDVSKLLIAHRDGRLLGMATSVRFRIPAGKRAFVEDVVVTEAARGERIGARLTLDCVRLANEYGAGEINLSSRADRKEAHSIYERLGFQKIETNFYGWAGRLRQPVLGDSPSPSPMMK